MVHPKELDFEIVTGPSGLLNEREPKFLRVIGIPDSLAPLWCYAQNSVPTLLGLHHIRVTFFLKQMKNDRIKGHNAVRKSHAGFNFDCPYPSIFFNETNFMRLIYPSYG